MTPMKEVLLRPESSYYIPMVGSFIDRIKDRTYHQKLGNVCRKILQEGIKYLFK